MFRHLLRFHFSRRSLYGTTRTHARPHPSFTPALCILRNNQHTTLTTDVLRLGNLMFGALLIADLCASTAVKRTICTASVHTGASGCAAFQYIQRLLGMASDPGTLRTTWLNSACHRLLDGSRAHRRRGAFHLRHSAMLAHGPPVPAGKTNASDPWRRGRWQSTC